MARWDSVRLGPFRFVSESNEIVSPARWHGCPDYNECLRSAGRKSWPSFTCKGCDLMPMRGSSDWTVDDSGQKVSLIVFEHECMSDGDELSKDHPEAPDPRLMIDPPPRSSRRGKSRGNIRTSRKKGGKR